MSHTPHYRFGPNRTQKALKYLLLWTLGTSLFAALFNNFFPQVLGWSSPYDWLSLSRWGISHYFFWQFLTYIFVHPFAQGVSFSFLFSLAFNLYLIWIVGSALLEKRGIASFLSFYFLSGIFVGLILFGAQTLFGSQLPFSGNTAVLYSLLITWLILNPDAQILLLVGMPLRAKSLVLTILAANLLIDISTGDWQHAIAYLAGAIFGYLYPVAIWKIPSPFTSLRPLEKILVGKRKAAMPSNARAKIYDFKTGQAILNDEEFLDAMLSKISLYGKKSLTWRERWRLRRISRRKKKQK